jgi:carboxymethylenebutenolidase
MRIAVFGALGNVGSRVVAEALSRGHEVTCVIRREAQLSSIPGEAQGRIADAGNAEQVAALCAGHDLVIGATRPAPGREGDLVSMTKALLAGTARAGVRLILVGGAASLKVPDTGGLVLDDSRYVPDFVRGIAVASRMQLEACKTDADADWTYLSPPALLVPGARTGRYRIGRDELLVGADGISTISIEDFAVALLDEAESPAHRRARFTVASRTAALTESDVMIGTRDGIADCHFVHPQTGAHPGVIVWPDAVGLRSTYRAIGRRLAESGYPVLVVNPYYRTTRAPIDVDAAGFLEPAGRERVMQLTKTVTPEMTATDAAAFVAYLDRQESVDTTRKLGTAGYCMGGAMALRTAAAVNGRIGAVASFHGGGLVTRDLNSPHRLIATMNANALIAIAQDDDEKNPEAKDALRQAFAASGSAAEIEVYDGAMHGWCVADAGAFDRERADKAWSRLLALFDESLA